MAEEKKKNKNQMLSNHSLTNCTEKKKSNPHLWRDLTAYWILGLCNNYGYVVMLSAAHDIIQKFDHITDDTVERDSGRMCNIMSTGAILLADILPALSLKILAPFIPLWVHFRVVFAIGAQIIGFLLVAFGNAKWISILGVICTSASSGMGEATFLAYSSKFNKNVISTWSSGTGGAGVIGSISYAGLIALNISPQNTMLIMLIFPILEGFSFWIILNNPQEIESTDNIDINVTSSIENEKPLLTIKQKLQFILQLFKYIIPLLLVYLFEYFINQGLFELVYFENIFLDKSSQYRWLNVDYQIGVLISRSSVNILRINKIWLMSILQFINVIYFLIEVMLSITPNIWIVFSIILWEGLLGGAAYVNTFYRIAQEVTGTRKLFALSFVALSDTVGITLAGFIAIPVHNAICDFPKPIRLF